MITQSSSPHRNRSELLKRQSSSKSAWANIRPSDDAGLFHRSAHTYVNYAVEAERGRKRKSARKQRKRIRKYGDGRYSPQRRKVSDDEDDDDDSMESDSGSNQIFNGETNPPAVQHQHEVNSMPQGLTVRPSLVQQYRKKIAESKVLEEKQRNTQPADMIDLDNRSDKGLPLPIEKYSARPGLITTPSAQMEMHSSSEEEFPELARKARDKARRKRLEQDISLLPQSYHSGSADEQLDTSITEPQAISSPPPLPLPPEPTLHILITSAIQDTQPLIVTRKLSQRLKDVRLAWAERQGFSEDFMATVFLTWRGKRLFDVTSCKSLGITVDTSGLILFKGDVLGDKEGRLHIEAVTPKMFERARKTKQDIQNGEVNEIIADEAHHNSSKEVIPQVRIILKGKGFDDFKLIVKPVSYPSLASLRSFLRR